MANLKNMYMLFRTDKQYKITALVAPCTNDIAAYRIAHNLIEKTTYKSKDQYNHLLTTGKTKGLHKEYEMVLLKVPTNEVFPLALEYVIFKPQFIHN